MTIKEMSTMYRDCYPTDEAKVAILIMMKRLQELVDHGACTSDDIREDLVTLAGDYGTLKRREMHI